MSTIRRALRVLAHGDPLPVFPEGWASSDGLPPRPGIGFLAVRSGAAIVGTERVLPVRSRRPHRHPIAVRIGSALTLERHAEKEDYATFAEAVMTEIKALQTGSPP